jgi:hypothetical protein
MGVIEKRPQHCGGCNCRGRSYWRGRPAMDSTQLPNVSAVCPAPDSLVEIALHPAYPRQPTTPTGFGGDRWPATGSQPLHDALQASMCFAVRAGAGAGEGGGAGRARWARPCARRRPSFFNADRRCRRGGLLGPVTGPTKSSRSLLGSCEGCASLINQRQPSYKFCRVGPSFRDAD